MNTTRKGGREVRDWGGGREGWENEREGERGGEKDGRMEGSQRAEAFSPNVIN